MSRLLAALVAAFAVVAGCGGGSGPGAPEILYGEDICDRCRMVISERRHAAAASLDGRDHRFDDPGCLRRWVDAVGDSETDSETGSEAGSEAGTQPVHAWVHDGAESWLAVEDAWFVVDPERGTPMASGILAFGGEAAAQAAGERFGAVPVRWPDLRDYSW